jgi:hypothetical protein
LIVILASDRHPLIWQIDKIDKLSDQLADPDVAERLLTAENPQQVVELLGPQPLPSTKPTSPSASTSGLAAARAAGSSVGIAPGVSGSRLGR